MDITTLMDTIYVHEDGCFFGFAGYRFCGSRGAARTGGALEHNMNTNITYAKDPKSLRAPTASSRSMIKLRFCDKKA